MNILVTGGSGFIGCHLVNRLSEKGYAVTVVDDLSRGRINFKENNRVEVSFGDIRDIKFVESVFERDFDSVFHLAAINGTSNFYEKARQVFEVGVVGTLNVVRAAIDRGVSNFVFASSAEVYGDADKVPTPENSDIKIKYPLPTRYSYGSSKLVGEFIMRYLGSGEFARTITFRPHNIYGPNMGYEHVIPQIAMKVYSSLNQGKSEIEIQGEGVETRAFCYVDDLIDGLEILLSKGNDGELYHIGNSIETNISNLVQFICNSMDTEMEIIKSKPLEASPSRRCPDISKMLSLGYSPRVNLEDGLRRTIEWYLTQESFKEKALEKWK